MFLLSLYPMTKVAAMIATLCCAQTYKNYKNLTFNQQDRVVNIPTKTNGITRSILNQAIQTKDLIDTFTKANQIKQSFDNLHSNESSAAQPKKNESVSQYKERNQKPLNAYQRLIFKEINPLLEKYAKKHDLPTTTELINDIFKKE
jgi:hypothetical protein